MISLMALNKKIYFAGIILVSLLAAGCQHKFLNSAVISVSALEFSEQIPKSFQVKSQKYFSVDSKKDGPIFSITKLTYKKKNFFGGPSARSQEIEVLGELQYSTRTVLEHRAQSVSASAQLPSNEASPQGEMVALTQLKGELEFLLLETLIMEYQLVEN
jgi:hypothetical protein